MKKFLCTFLSLLMLLSLAIVPTFADDTTTTPTTGYSADFEGKLTEEEMEKIPNIKAWYNPDEATWENVDWTSKTATSTYFDDSAYATVKITDADGLMFFASVVNAGANCGTKTVYLANDISVGEAYSKVWKPIGNNTGNVEANASMPYFNGIFDGQGYAIKDLDVNVDSTADKVNVALFGRFGQNGTSSVATIKNLVIDSSCSFTYTGANSTAKTAALVAFTWQQSSGVYLISNVENNADVSANGGAVGGFVAQAGAWTGTTSSIISCTNNGDITATGTFYLDGANASSGELAAAAGGIAGYGRRMNVDIKYCVNNGAITATGYAAGIRAGNVAHTVSGETSSVWYCVNRGKITGLDASGITNIYNSASALIKFCTNTGKIVATNETNSTTYQICAIQSATPTFEHYFRYSDFTVVPDDVAVSIIGYQKQIVGANATNRSVRLVGKLTADEAELANYAKVGLIITATYKVGDMTVVKELKGESTSVYKALNAIDGGVNSDPTEITCGDGEYFFAVVLKNIPISIGEIELQVTPYSIDANDTVVNGFTGNATVDVADNAING